MVFPNKIPQWFRRDSRKPTAAGPGLALKVTSDAERLTRLTRRMAAWLGAVGVHGDLWHVELLINNQNMEKSPFLLVKYYIYMVK